MAQRIRFVSFLQIVGVMVVLLGHSLHEYPTDCREFWLFKLIYTVNMPLFVFISGYLFTATAARRVGGITFGGFVNKKARRLLVPYFFIAIVAFLPRALMSGFADDPDPVSLDFHTFAASLFFSDKMTVTFLWYLPMIFCMLCLAFLGWRASRGNERAFFLVGGAIALVSYLFVNPWAWRFMAVGRVADLAIFFLLGAAYERWKPSLDRWAGRWWFAVGCAAVWLSLFFAGNLPIALQLLCALTGVAMFVSLSNLVCEWPLGWTHLDGFSYLIYLFSWFICALSQQVLHHFTDFPWWVYTVVSMLAGVYIPWSIGKLLYRYAPVSRVARSLLWLLGHNYKKS